MDMKVFFVMGNILIYYLLYKVLGFDINIYDNFKNNYRLVCID